MPTQLRVHDVLAEVVPVCEKLRLPGAGIRAATICRSWSTVVDCKSTPLERLKFWYRRHIRQLRRFRNRRFHNGHRGFHSGRPLRNRIQRCDCQWCCRVGWVGLIFWPLRHCWSGSVVLPCQLQEHVRTCFCPRSLWWRRCQCRFLWWDEWYDLLFRWCFLGAASYRVCRLGIL